MKKLLTILFLAILAFNLFGYRLLIDYLQQQQAVSFQTSLHGPLNEADLMTLKTPVTLPYYTNSAQYEWVDGEVVLDGRLYRYVQRRIYNDSIEYRCLQNAGKMRLESAREAFFKLCNDLQHTPVDKKASGPVKPLLLEYYADAGPFQFLLPPASKPRFPISVAARLVLNAATTLEQPPEVRILFS